MMGIPPSNIPPGSSGGSDSSSRSEGPEGKPKKPFNPVTRRERREEGEKRKSHFDLIKEKKAEREAEAAVDQKLEHEQKLGKDEALSEMKGAQAVESKQAVAQITKLIQAMVEKMHIGSIGGKDFASLDLKGTPEVPGFFAGSTLTLTQTDEGLLIDFSNFESPQQVQQAILAVEHNKAQLEQMMLNMQTKNVHVAQMLIGGQQIALPQVRPPASIFEAPPPSAQTQRDRGRGDQGRGDEEGPSE